MIRLVFSLAILPWVLTASTLHSVKIENVFVPVGFDDNDETVVVLDGYLPDPCHQLDETVLNYDSSTGEYVLDQKARRETGFCPDVTVPYTKTISLGTLRQGQYSVKAAGANTTEALDIGASSKELPDDYLYAPVDQATIRVVPTAKQAFAVLEGRFTTTCLKLDEVKVIHTGRTIQVLPIMELKKADPSGDPCDVTEKSFKQVVKLPALKDQRYLLHVRSLNGQSKNVVFNPYVN